MKCEIVFKPRKRGYYLSAVGNLDRFIKETPIREKQYTIADMMNGEIPVNINMEHTGEDICEAEISIDSVEGAVFLDFISVQQGPKAMAIHTDVGIIAGEFFLYSQKVETDIRTGKTQHTLHLHSENYYMPNETCRAVGSST